MNTATLVAEMRYALAELDIAHHAELAAAGVPAIAHAVGASRIRVEGSFYWPDPEGHPAYITPVLVDNPLTPESSIQTYIDLPYLVDLLAWHPRHPARWALRVGAAEWLGFVEPQLLDPDPVIVRRWPYNWLRASCTGLVLLSREGASAYRVLSSVRAILAEDTAHAAELRQIAERPWSLPSIEVACHAN
jgi:hypothetical protein